MPAPMTGNGTSSGSPDIHVDLGTPLEALSSACFTRGSMTRSASRNSAPSFCFLNLAQTNGVVTDVSVSRQKDHRVEREVIDFLVELELVHGLADIALDISPVPIAIREFEGVRPLLQGAVASGAGNLRLARCLARSLPFDLQTHVADRCVVSGHRRASVGVQSVKEGSPVRLCHPARPFARGPVQADDMAVDRHARIRRSTQQPDRLEQGRLAGVVPPGHQIDPAQTADRDVVESPIVAYVDSFEHGYRPLAGAAPDSRLHGPGDENPTGFPQPGTAGTKRRTSGWCWPGSGCRCLAFLAWGAFGSVQRHLSTEAVLLPFPSACEEPPAAPSSPCR